MTFHPSWNTKFPYHISQGQFPGPYEKYWDAYPSSYPDTAKQRHYPVGGNYDPGVISAARGVMSVRMYRGTGDVHSCALLPKAAQNKLYGRYTESFVVSGIAVGYKSAHLLWPASGNQNSDSYEVDYPENEWDTSINMFIHQAGQSQQYYDTNAKWGVPHTTVIEWSPGLLTFYLDGKQVYQTTRMVPDIPMDWIIQNESALNGEAAAPNSSAQIDFTYVAYDKWVP